MTEADAQPEAPADRHVLVVDDDDEVTATVAEMLRSAGYQVTTTSSGRQALGLIETNHYDAVVLDLAMPGTGGIGVIDELGERGVKIPVVVLSGYLGMMGKSRILELGAVAVLEKPADFDELTAALEKAIEGKTE